MAKRLPFNIRLRRACGRTSHRMQRALGVNTFPRIKRLFDVAASGVAVVMCLPLFVLIAAAIKITSRGPVFFKQTRVGEHGVTFSMLKFQSMYVDAEARKAQLARAHQDPGGIRFKLRNDPRITSVGKLLRKTSLDELPQLLNVLTGDMTLVGPRPPIPSEVRAYTLEERVRLNCKPGITCIWQVSGRSEIPFDQQVLLDEQYVYGRNARMDFRLILATIPAVLLGRGAY